MAQATAYKGMISARSQRLRVWGGILLAAVLGMAAYGSLSLMPTLRGNITRYREAKTGETTATAQAVRKQEAALRVHLLTAYGFWSVCGLLTLGLFTVGWMDWREVQRNYLDERRKIWSNFGNNQRGEAGIPDDLR